MVRTGKREVLVVLLLLGPFFLMLSSCQKKDSAAEVQGIFEGESIFVSSMVDGRVDCMKVQEGQILHKGDTIAQIDTLMMTYQLDYIKTQQETAQTAGVVSPSIQTEALQVQITALEKEVQRISRLVKEGVLPQSRLTQITTQLEAAKAQKAAAIQQVQKKNSGSIGGSESLDSQIAQVKEMMARSTIVAPTDGTILTTYVHEGELTGAGRPLLKMADLSTLQLRVYLSPEQLSRIKIGDKVKVYNDMGGKDDRAYEGTVSWISEKAEFTPKNIQTSSMRSTLIYAAKVLVPNDGYLKIGQYGKAILPPLNDSQRESK